MLGINECCTKNLKRLTMVKAGINQVSEDNCEGEYWTTARLKRVVSVSISISDSGGAMLAACRMRLYDEDRRPQAAG